MRIIQIVPNLNYGDAIGNHIIAVKHIIESIGYKTMIYCNDKHPKITEPDVYLMSEFGKPEPDDIIIYHLSIGSELNQKTAELNCRTIMVYHNITPPHFFAVDSFEKAEICRAGLADVKRLAGKYDYCLADSEFNRQDLIKMGYAPDKIEVSPIIIAMDDYKQQADEEIIKKYSDDITNILFVGRIAPNKKHEDLIRTFTYYNKEINPKSRLILAGNYDDKNGNYYKDLCGYIKSIKAENIIFTGHISFAELLGYYKTADIFLCLSEHEGFCVPLVEAMMADIPIIAYDSCAVPETMGKSGIVTDNKDPVFIASIIDRLVNDSELREHVIETQQNRLKDFMFEPLSIEFKKTLEKFISKKLK